MLARFSRRDAGRFLARVRHQFRVFERDLVDEGVEAEALHPSPGAEKSPARWPKAGCGVAAAQQAQAYPACAVVAVRMLSIQSRRLYIGFRLVRAVPDWRKAEVLGIEEVRRLPEACVVKVVRRILPAEIGLITGVADFMGRADLVCAGDDRLSGYQS